MFIKPKLPPDAEILAKKLIYCFPKDQNVKVSTGEVLSGRLLENGDFFIKVDTPKSVNNQTPQRLEANLTPCFFSNGLRQKGKMVLTDFPDVEGHGGLAPIINPKNGFEILVNALRAMRCKK